jgi:ADP-ribose pyrophosphatase YjhB (NUDIX family)
MSICDHRCVGALIQSEQGILMFQRNTPPAGYAGPAGHCDGDGYVEALIREVWEEVGLWVVRWRLITEFYDANPCRREYEGEPGHHWQFFDVDVKGDIQARESGVGFALVSIARSGNASDLKAMAVPTGIAFLFANCWNRKLEECPNVPSCCKLNRSWVY